MGSLVGFKTALLSLSTTLNERERWEGGRERKERAHIHLPSSPLLGLFLLRDALLSSLSLSNHTSRIQSSLLHPTVHWPALSLSAYDQLAGKVSVTQISDTMSFVRTFHHLSLHPPTLILVTDTALPTPDQPGVHRNRLSGIASGRPVQPTLLVQSLMEGWQDVECVPISRRYWNDEAGELG